MRAQHVAARRRASTFTRRAADARIVYRASEYARARPLTWSEAAALTASGQESPPRSRWHFAVRDTAHAFAWAWLRIDPDGWVRPAYAASLVVGVLTGTQPARGAWRSWTNNPGQDRYSRRRMDALRRIGRMDSTERKVAQLYGWWSRYPVAPRRASDIPGPVLARLAAARTVTDGPARAHPAPRWVVRRARLVRWFASAVAQGHVRPPALRDAWAVAAAASDRVDTSTPYASSRSSRTGGDSAADADRR
jgi:hypothetical protein